MFVWKLVVPLMYCVVWVLKLKSPLQGNNLLTANMDYKMDAPWTVHCMMTREWIQTWHVSIWSTLKRKHPWQPFVWLFETKKLEKKLQGFSKCSLPKWPTDRHFLHYYYWKKKRLKNDGTISRVFTFKCRSNPTTKHVSIINYNGIQ